jgi:hypothetical protein
MSFKRDENNLFVATGNFKMPKTAKRMFATITDAGLRNHWKACMAQAAMQSFEVIEKKKKNVNGKVELAV